MNQSLPTDQQSEQQPPAGERDNAPPAEQTMMFRLIGAALLVWSATLAWGAYLYEDEPIKAAIKGALVFGCSLTFVLFWAYLVHRRGRRPPG